MKSTLYAPLACALLPLVGCAQSYYAPNLQAFDPPVYVRGVNSPCGAAGTEWINTVSLNTWLCGTDGQWHPNTGGSAGGYTPFSGAGIVKATGSGTTTQAATSTDVDTLYGYTPVSPTNPGVLAANEATSSGAGSTIVKRDENGDFVASTITANLLGNGTGTWTGPVIGNVTGNVSGNAGTATALAAAPSVCSGGQVATGINASGNPAACVSPGGFPATATGYLYNDGTGTKTWVAGTGATPPTINYTPTGTGANTITQQTENLKTIYFCKDWGACDGSTDDTANWNNAVNAISGNATDIVIPMGKTVLLHGPTWKNNLSLVCGPGATIKDFGGSATTHFLPLTFVTAPQIHGCILNKNGQVETGGNNAMIYLQGATGFVIDGNTFTNSGTPSTGTSAILVYQSNGGKITNNTIDNTILATQIDVNNGTTVQRSIRASTLIGSNALDNLLWIQASAPGTAGNSQTVTIANDGASQSLSFSGTSAALTIHLATNASSVSTSTAASIIAAFQGNALQQYFLVQTRDTGTGIVAANSVTTLSGGLASLSPVLVAGNSLDGSQSQGIHVEVGGGSAGTWCNVEVRNNSITHVWDWTDYQATSSAHSGENGNGIDLDNCSGVYVHDNLTDWTDFSGIRVYNGWNNRIINNEIRHAGEQSLYNEFNAQNNLFQGNTISDSLFGVNDNNAELRTNLGLNQYIANSFTNIYGGTAVQCNACILKDNTVEGAVTGFSIGGGGAGGYNSQIVNNTCTVSQNTAYPKLLNCISVGASYGGSDALIQGNNTIGTPVFGHIWGSGNPSGHITNVTLGNPTTVTFSSGSPATGNSVCLFGIGIFSTHELNGNCYVATVSGSSFTIPIDSTSFTPWVAVTSAANPGSANGWRFPSFWYDGNLATSPAAFNSHMRVRDENFKDAVKGTPANGSSGYIVDDDCSSGALSNLGAGSGTWAKYNNAWTCW